jgi:hypothetical protein
MAARVLLALSVLSIADAQKSCTGTTSVYGAAAGKMNYINGSAIDFASFAGTVTLFTNVASF